MQHMTKFFEFIPILRLTLIQFLSLKCYIIFGHIFLVIFFTPVCYLASLYLNFMSLGNNLELLCLTTNLTCSDGHSCYILLWTHSKPFIWSNTFNVLHTLESWIIGPGRLLILEKNSTQDMFIPATPFIWVWNIFHALLLLGTLFSEKPFCNAGNKC